MTEEESKSLIKHLSDKRFCNFVITNIINNNGKEYAIQFNNYLIAAYNDIVNFKTSDQEKLSDKTIELVNKNKDYFLNLINDYEEIKRNNAAKMMNNLNENIDKEVVIKYWDMNKGSLETQNTILKDVENYGHITTESDTIPFIGYKKAIYTIETLDGINLYKNPNIKNNYDVYNDNTVKLAQEDIFGEEYNKQLNNNKDNDNDKENDNNQNSNTNSNDEFNSLDHFHCPYCSAENDLDAAFCGQCGRKLGDFNQSLSIEIVREYYAKQIRELDETIKECEKDLEENLNPKKEAFIELETFKVLKRMLNENCEYFINNLQDIISKGTAKKDNNYQEKLDRLDEVIKEIETETNSKKIKRATTRKDDLSKKIGEIAVSQRKTINKKLKSHYNKLENKAFSQGEKIGEYNYNDNKIDLFENKINKIDDNQSNFILKAGIQKIIKSITNFRISRLRKKQGILNDQIVKKQISGDEVHFKI